ncbi:MAG TPA: LacI family DNA-binding transcriptional regulator [Acidimicrobiia bacterium]|nr:LacI family DNA-binding transcriptional regulator [Acidimicrobiia bacterium]
MSDRVTLRDVALEAGVHISTASRALNDQTSSIVSPETGRRVMEAARKLGYSPNPLAKGLRTHRTMSVGVVIPDIENPLFGPIIAGIEGRLAEEGYSTLITDAGRSDPDLVSSVVETLIERRVDGMILAMATRTGSTVESIHRRNIPVVLVNRTSEGVPVPSIVGDDQIGIGLAVEHLADLGHVHIGHIAGPKGLSTGMGRFQAFVSSMEDRGLAAGPEVVAQADWYQVEPGYKAARELLDRRPDLTAIVCANDLIALGAYRAIRERGLEVGPDVSVTGYNDIPLLDLLQPALTSVRIPYRKMGSEAASMLLGMMFSDENSPSQETSMRLRPTLSVRASTQPPREG